MTATVERGVLQDATTVALGHRENCLCLKALRALPPMMMDERRVATVPLLDSSLLDLLARKLEDEGRPW